MCVLQPQLFLRAVLGVALGAVALRTIVARLPGWNPESLWVDDLIFGSLIRADLYSMVTAPGHYAPGLFVVWRAFYELFPDPEWSLQILPFACGIAAIPVMAILGQRLTGDVALGALAGAVTAVNPLLALYTVYVHHYTIEFLLTALFLVAATGLHAPDRGIDPRRFGRVALCGGVAAFFSAASLFVSFTMVHLGAAFAVVSRRRHPRATRTVLWWSAAYDLIVVVAVLVLGGRSNAHTRDWFAPGFMPTDSIRAARGVLGGAGSQRGREEHAELDRGGGSRMEHAGDTVVAVGVHRSRTHLAGGPAAHPVHRSGGGGHLRGGGGRERFGPVSDGYRPYRYLYPSGGHRALHGWPLVCDGRPATSIRRRDYWPATVAIALAVSYPVPVDYRQRNDVHLVNHLSAYSLPSDWIMMSFSAGYLAAFYGPWDVTPIPYETSTGFVTTIARNNVLHLPLRLDYNDPNGDEARAAGEHRRIVRDFLEERRPARIWFLGYYAETFHGTKWAPNVLDVLTDHGYRVEKMMQTSRGELYLGTLRGV